MWDDESQLVPDRRIDDADRDRVVAHLRRATVDGSLDLDELGVRIEQVFEARTAGELAQVTDDLPAPPPEQPEPARRPRRRVWGDAGFRAHFASWALTNGFLTGIWVMGGAGHFWPFYPAAGWGIGLGLHAMSVAGWHHHSSRPSDRHRADRDTERRARDERRAAQRAARDELKAAGQELAIDVQRNAARAVRQLGTGPHGPDPRWPGAHGPGGHRSGPRPPRGGRYRSGSRPPGGGEPVERVTALFVDIVGSTQLNAAMGDEAWSTVRSRFRELVGRCLGEHGGTEVNVAGDGILVRFDHEVGAVRCAVGIQRALAEQRDSTGFAPSVRVGLHAGTAYSDGSDLVGHVINLAARVTDEAEPGEVLVTEAVAERVGDRFRIDDRGLRTLKGIAQPRHLLAIDWT